MSCTECQYLTTHCSVKGDMQDRFAYLVPKWKEQFKVSVLGEMEQFKWEVIMSGVTGFKGGQQKWGEAIVPVEGVEFGNVRQRGQKQTAF